MSTESTQADPTTAALFTPLQVGAWHLQHRVVMAPLTRNRAVGPTNVPQEMNVTYYRQRASAGGLLISEATQVTPEGQGYPTTPGIHSAEQVEGWKPITDAVHEKDGLIVLQLWHVGRSSHSSFQPGGALPVAPSAIAINGKVTTASFEQADYETPRALELDELPGIVEAYRKGAENAKAAGFNGVEIHGANGYLLDQFLRDKSNHRTDAYGGSLENRARLTVEVAEAVASVWGGDRVGIRLSPFGAFNDMGDSNPVPTYRHLLGELTRIGLCYAHFIEPRADGVEDAALGEHAGKTVGEIFKENFPNKIIAAGGFNGPDAAALVEAGKADAVAFGRWFIANPDLPKRFRLGAKLNPYDRGTFYGGDEKGYIDYPSLQHA